MNNPHLLWVLNDPETTIRELDQYCRLSNKSLIIRYKVGCKPLIHGIRAYDYIRKVKA